MTSFRIALATSVAAAALWAAKAVAIGTAGGLDQSPLEGPLFFAGFLCFITSVASVGFGLARRRRLGVRLLAGLAGPVVTALSVAALTAVIDSVLQPSSSRHWIWSEITLWVPAVVLIALAARLVTRVHDGGRASIAA